MAKFFKHEGVVCLRRTAAEESRHPVPAGATDVIAFDEETNAAVIADFSAGCNPYTLAGGQLLKDGVQVAFAADGADKTTRDEIRAQAAAAITQFLRTGV